jgi:predicted Zn-dependent peptidase
VAGVDPKRVEEAIAVILSEYSKVNSSAKGGSKVKSEELKKAKEFLKGHLVLELEDSRAVAGFFASQELLEKKIDTPEEVIEKINKVSLEEVQDVAKRYFVNKGLNLAAIGNFPNGQRFEKMLEL